MVTSLLEQHVPHLGEIAAFVENVTVTSRNIFKGLSLKPLCHLGACWQADCATEQTCGVRFHVLVNL